eukprot:Hpha_TRINITY_DN15648_c1_g4::TRINITY_DN15648_c1_g4_i1::g.99704::m.99704
MLALGVLTAAAVSTKGWFNVSGATPEALSAAQQSYFDSVNLGGVWGPEVNTTGGMVGGWRHIKDGVDVFWNIPFAAPTSGAGRFAKPEDPAPWSGVRRALFPPRWCPQMRIGGFFFGEEDCLHLNVFRPRDIRKDEKLPVMVWIYGGGFVIGDSVELGNYNAKNLSRTQRVIVVSINYRLGSLGFLALDSLRQEQGTAGNWGLLDQQKALHWVQKNIAAFGGDTGRVTIFGESAGGCSVVAHLAMPGSRGLFHGAIAESPLSATDIAWAPWKNSSAFGEAWATSVGCQGTGAAQLDCLRALPLKKALSPLLLTQFPPGTPASAKPLLTPIMSWWPTIDGSVLPASPLDQASRGELADVPLMLGTNKNEGSIFLPFISLITNGSASYPLTEQGLKTTLHHFFNASAVDKILAEYPLSAGGDYPFRASRIGGHILRDWIFTCAGRRLLRAMNTAGRNSSLYMYHFEFDLGGLPYEVAGDYHSSEIEFVFDNLGSDPAANYTLLAAQMGSYWASFAKGSNTASPLDHIECTAKTALGKSECLPFLPYTVTETRSGADPYMVFNKDIHMAQGLFEQHCDFWDTQVGYQRLL